MKALSPISILLAVIAWGLMIMMGVNLLSGEALADRTCDTSCVQTFFFSSLAVAGIAFIVSGLSIKGSGFNLLNILALLASLAICGIAVFLFIAGNFF